MQYNIINLTATVNNQRHENLTFISVKTLILVAINIHKLKKSLFVIYTVDVAKELT